MTAVSHDVSRSGVYDSGLAEIRAAAVEMARVAEDLAAVGTRLTSALTDSRGAGRAAQRALLHAATNVGGLGYALRGRSLGGVAQRFTALRGRDSLATLIAVCSLRLRIAAVVRSHPEIAEEPMVAELVAAVNADHSVAALRALRKLVRQWGLGTTLHTIAPVLTELLAVNALLDANPLNDEAGWAIACGRPLTRVPILGTSTEVVSRWDVGDGDSHPVDLDPGERAAVGAPGSITGLLETLAVLKNNGRVHLQQVEADDGRTRYIVFAPGMQSGMPRNDSPQDLVGAWCNTMRNESPYTRALFKTLRTFGVPDGADIALVGHSEGGAAVMNLAQDPNVSAHYRVTHVIAVGAPVDFKQPPETAFVATITNQHDLIPTLDGQGPGSPFHEQLHPHWYVVDYNDDTHQFPACHHVNKYLHNLIHDLHEARAHIDEALLPYRGKVVREQAYRIFDDRHAPDGFPYLTVATVPVPTSAGAVELPVRCAESTAVTSVFRVDAAAAEAELRGTGLRPVLLGRRAVAVVLARRFTRSSLGAHSEVSIALLVHDPWRRRPLLVWPELLSRADRRGSGLRVADLAVGNRSAAACAADIWGYPAFPAQVDVQLGRGRLTATVAVDRTPTLALEGRLGRWLPGPELDLVTYSTRAARLLRSVIDTRGGQRVHAVPRLRVRVGGGHPMAERARRLGLDGARPFLVLSAIGYQAKLGAGVEIPAPSEQITR